MDGLVRDTLALIKQMRRRLGAFSSGRWRAFRQLIATGGLRLPPHAEFLLPAIVLLQVIGLVSLSKALQGSIDISPPILPAVHAPIPVPIRAHSPAVFLGSPDSVPRDDSTQWSALDRLNEIAAMRPLLDASDQGDILPGAIDSQASVAAEPEVAGALTWWEQGLTPFHELLEPVHPAVADAKAIPDGEKATDEGTVARNPVQEAQAVSRDATVPPDKEASGTTAHAGLALPAQANPASAEAKQPAAGEKSNGAALSWLRAEEPGHFTLQLLSARRVATLRKFAAGHKLPGPVSIVTSMRNGAELFSLVHGAYASYAAAVAASKKLMAEFKLEQPWVRTIERVVTQMTGEESLPDADLSAAAR